MCLIVRLGLRPPSCEGSMGLVSKGTSLDVVPIKVRLSVRHLDDSAKVLRVEVRYLGELKPEIREQEDHVN